ncbi:hypothetical protein ACFQ4K_15840 [Tistrella bauzanensis]
MLAMSTDPDSEDCIWDFETLGTKSGFYVKARRSGPYGTHLYWNGSQFGLYGIASDDQIWVAQLA